MAGTTGRDSDKFMLRLPAGMRERIKASAEENNRSMNAEIVHALDFYFAFDNLGPSDENGTAPLDPPQAVRTSDDASKVAAAMARRYQRDLELAMIRMLREEADE
ncbi:Arc family DNA-binding protein [Citreimonas salinaria]|uniref:Arc-like DNA binding domain-containing protein n=1 Tax=Citreimonas salinaria TaxID=321339 RepID=A0A1H3HRJ4_9RHOB|nr:Arc family DNA-binding protein [Citreimonas salinaria]SDY18052.1 Arc-like DNA binding domain-containing protein [Citreimonas salinaria]